MALSTAKTDALLESIDLLCCHDVPKAECVVTELIIFDRAASPYEPPVYISGR
jgi:hypothetical protein